MDRAERRARMLRMRHHVMDHNVYRWAASILGDLRDLRIESPGTAVDQGRAQPASVSPIDIARRKLA
jgi:trehalose 6-phosphate synthase